MLPALSATGDTTTAYRLLTETECPSWLYPVTMGATTIWERWDSMLPDGSINPGRDDVVQPLRARRRRRLDAPDDRRHRPGGAGLPGVALSRRCPDAASTRASSSLRTPYGPASCAWSLDGDDVTLEVEVPPNTSATVVRPGCDDEPLHVLSGEYRWDYTVPESVASEWS